MATSGLLIAALLLGVQQEGVVRGAQPIDTSLQPRQHRGYAGRHALIVGIENYQDPRIGKLGYAVDDARAVAGLLQDRYGFPKSQIKLLLNEQATRDAILSGLEDWAANPSQIGPDDLFVFFYAGHGFSRDIPHRGNEKRGYLAPVDAAEDPETGREKWSQFIEMDRLDSISELLPARHAVFVLDCCFSGLVLRRSAPSAEPRLQNVARQVMTAGTRWQAVSDSGGGGHSIFTGFLLQGLTGDADSDGSGSITFLELYNYVNEMVRSSSDQDPLYTTLASDDGGNAVFYPPGQKVTSRPYSERLEDAEEMNRKLAEEKRQLADIILVEDLTREIDELWPRRLGTVPRMHRWLSQVEAVLSRLPRHEETLRRIRRQNPQSDKTDGATDNSGTQGESSRPDDPLLRLRLRQFEKMVKSLRALGTHVSEIERRAALAAQVEKVTLEDHADAWELAIEEVADNPDYEGINIRPIGGLIPIGPDPDTEYQEFWVWETGAEPERNEATGRVIMGPETGVVLDLLPGGTFTMGATPKIGGPNRDPHALPEEEPPTDISLDPFFLSKFEMTQGQWLRITGHNPSKYNPVEGFGVTPITLAHPVETVSWNECVTVFSHVLLTLPTEAQWEYACRAGTSSPWSTGYQKESLIHHANIADDRARRESGEANWVYEAWDDGHVVHSPVGAFLPNPFGLYDMHGNVWEWVLDDYTEYRKVPPRAGDGLRIPLTPTGIKIMRGGGYYYAAVAARSSCRDDTPPDYRHLEVGVRPALNLPRDQK